MHAESGGLRHRVDQAREGRASGQRIVIALGIVQRRHAGGGRSRQCAGNGLCAEPGAIDYAARPAARCGYCRRWRRRAPCRGSTRPPSTRLCSASTAPSRSASPSSESIRAWLSMMPVGGESRAARHSSAGSRARAASRESRCRSSTPLARARAAMASSSSTLGFAGGDDQLAAAPMGNAAFGAVGVEQRLPATQSRALSEPAG
jgi:hypothetical protein